MGLDEESIKLAISRAVRKTIRRAKADIATEAANTGEKLDDKRFFERIKKDRESLKSTRSKLTIYTFLMQSGILNPKQTEKGVLVPQSLFFESAFIRIYRNAVRVLRRKTKNRYPIHGVKIPVEERFGVGIREAKTKIEQDFQKILALEMKKNAKRR